MMALSMRVLSHFQALSFSITVLLSFCHAGTNDSSRDDRASIERLIFFGDSFTDQSRSHSISNESYPRKGYQEVYPPADSGINGGISWPWSVPNLYGFRNVGLTSPPQVPKPIYGLTI